MHRSTIGGTEVDPLPAETDREIGASNALDLAVRNGQTTTQRGRAERLALREATGELSSRERRQCARDAVGELFHHGAVPLGVEVGEQEIERGLLRKRRHGVANQEIRVPEK